jgi:hypothetical protein
VAQPIGLQRRGLQWHVVYVERRRASPDAPPDLRDRDPRPHPSFIDRRVGAGSNVTGSLRWIKGLIGRSMRLERSGRRFQLVLVERRQASRAGHAAAVLVTDFGRSVFGAEFGDLTRVDDALARQGWSGVESLSSRVLGNALKQAEALAGRDPSPSLSALTERLSAAKVAAETREDRKLQRMKLEADSLVVSEATLEEFEATSRSWADRATPAPAPDAERNHGAATE